MLITVSDSQVSHQTYAISRGTAQESMLYEAHQGILLHNVGESLVSWKSDDFFLHAQHL